MRLTPDDRVQISDLKAKYFRYIDTRNWHGLRSLFVDSAIVEGMPREWGVLDSADKFLEKIQVQFESGSVTVHHGHMAEVRGFGPDRARGIWSMEDYVTWDQGDRVYRGVHISDMWGFRGYGHYEDEFVRIDGDWKFAFVRLTRLRIDPLVGEPPLQVPFVAVPVSDDWLPI
ncbi:nuclear transport factor 2 family protein [Arthrobacter sp. KNU40]|uniref:nuclear transport factor 2 family protein n=1 Tax=Arthrobacter sp. KNU40 TaxID=3447965 RepID=UPI003F63AC91